MANGNYENKILEAIQMLVENAVSKAEYDKTIKGIVSRCIDATIGKYVVKYQNSSFYAYSYNHDVTYPAGTAVYVLIPRNDMSQEKTIVGTVEKLGPDYISITEGDNGYEIIGVNNIHSKQKFQLCSYEKEQVKILYDRDNNVNLIDLDVFGFEEYMKNATAIICGAKFKTQLPEEQKFRGDYGISFSLDFIDNATQEIITKTFLVNIDQMIGNPYNLMQETRQYGIFDVNGANFKSVKNISIFQHHFPNTEINKSDDIFISDLELSSAQKINQEELSGYSLTFSTPQGTYFDEKDVDNDIRTIESIIKIKGKIVDTNSFNIKYYWFIEDNSITNSSTYYNQYGGKGWRCLNTYNVIKEATESEKAIVEWIPASYKYITRKKDNIAKETLYKCAAIYNEQTILTKTISIKNFSSNYNITIKSDTGEIFYYDLGMPTLTCYVNNQENNTDYTYIWSQVDSNNVFTSLVETNDKNTDYNNALKSYQILLNKIENEEILAGAAQEQLKIYQDILNHYKNIMRVEKNKIINLTISQINKFSTYKCSVFYKNTFVGSSSITISNILDNDNNYNLIINNGNQVFKYNEEGISPASLSLADPIEILPLSFTVFDNKGKEVNINAIDLKKVKWVIPTKNTMLSVEDGIGRPIESTDTEDTYVQFSTFNFKINTLYDLYKSSNTIKLIVEYKDKILTAATNFIFTKEGENGTNGTEFICKILPNIDNQAQAPKKILVTYNRATKQYSLNFTPKKGAGHKWFKAQLWHNGEVIYEGTESGISLEEEKNPVTVSWKMLKNKYENQTEDESSFSINKITGELDFHFLANARANLLRCTVRYKNAEYYATIPLAVAAILSSDYEVTLDNEGGFQDVMYTPDGRYPKYNNANPFNVNIFQKINGIKENISLLKTSEYAVDFSWNSYSSQGLGTDLLIFEDKIRNKGLNKNSKYFKPKNEFNGLSVVNGIICKIFHLNKGIHTEEIASIEIPIYLFLNRYGNAAINEWDGNSISLNEKDGVILAPQVGAGQKDKNNAFTGIFMGSVKENGSPKIENGLFGYDKGQRTLEINAADGSAKFGKKGAGQIIMDPSTDTAILQSGNYDTEAGTGMRIDLSAPSIRFGSGKFGVNSEGQLFAEGFATTGYVDAVDKKVTEVEEQVKKTVKTITVLYALGDDSVTPPLQGWSKVSPQWEKGKYMWQKTFTEYVDGTTKESEPTCIQGAKGENGSQGPAGQSGENGKSSYQLWLEAGNVGTEEDYMNSLKGQKGEDGKGIVESIITYQISDNGTDIPQGEWHPTVQETTKDNPFLWTKTYLKYSDGTHEESYSVGSTIAGVDEIIQDTNNKVTEIDKQTQQNTQDIEKHYSEFVVNNQNLKYALTTAGGNNLFKNSDMANKQQFWRRWINQLWYETPYTPPNPKVGDYWYCTESHGSYMAGQMYYYSSSGWQKSPYSREQLEAEVNWEFVRVIEDADARKKTLSGRYLNFDLSKIDTHLFCLTNMIDYKEEVSSYSMSFKIDNHVETGCAYVLLAWYHETAEELEVGHEDHQVEAMYLQDMVFTPDDMNELGEIKLENLINVKKQDFIEATVSTTAPTDTSKAWLDTSFKFGVLKKYHEGQWVLDTSHMSCYDTKLRNVWVFSALAGMYMATRINYDTNDIKTVVGVITGYGGWFINTDPVMPKALPKNWYWVNTKDPNATIYRSKYYGEQFVSMVATKMKTKDLQPVPSPPFAVTQQIRPTGYFKIADLKLEYGSVCTPWNRHPGEIYNKDFKFDETGMTIASGKNTMKIDEDDITATYLDDTIFKISEYNTYMKQMTTYKMNMGTYIEEERLIGNDKFLLFY